MDNDQHNIQPLIPAHALVDVGFGGEIDRFYWSFKVQNLLNYYYFDYAIASPFPDGFGSKLGRYNAKRNGRADQVADIRSSSMKMIRDKLARGIGFFVPFVGRTCNSLWRRVRSIKTAAYFRRQSATISTAHWFCM